MAEVPLYLFRDHFMADSFGPISRDPSLRCHRSRGRCSAEAGSLHNELEWAGQTSAELNSAPSCHMSSACPHRIPPLLQG